MSPAFTPRDRRQYALPVGGPRKRGINAEVVNGVWTGQEPAFDHPFNLGAHCAKGAAVLVTGHDSYSAGRIVDLGQSVGDVMETDVVRVEPHTLLAEAAEDLGQLGRAVVADARDQLVRVAGSGIGGYSGDGGAAVEATFNWPHEVRADEAGNLYVAAGLHDTRNTSETLSTRPGIHVISPKGTLLAFRETPEDTVSSE